MTTTATAATQADVTIATVRRWCRRGVVAAVKVAGRWVIDTASLARRIAIGAWRQTVTKQTAPAPGTMGARGQGYVAAWPARIAQQIGLSPAYVAEALTRTGLSTRDEQGSLGQAFLRGGPVAQIAALTPDTAKAVIAELRAIAAEISEAAKTHCHCCGLKLPKNGDCPSCGTLEY
ncbi:helix-turn-helix domain-containing protein [Streptomyces sp. NPDC006971]|uniref:helix-turn-helix domain-containing protein n=1 Tax=Streptomyces sp. NPDC006971 TaxID=3154784 RepID=UPI0033CB599E